MFIIQSIQIDNNSQVFHKTNANRRKNLTIKIIQQMIESRFYKNDYLTVFITLNSY